ncbi:MAG TPA: cell division protein ZapB [Thermodesulfobacteriota bacterium]|nr:cell division protein ZapB [Thermodesulfobacteriota bacterium]
MSEETDKFDVLEEKIAQLVNAYSMLRDEKKLLGEQLAQKEWEIQKLQEKISHLSREREAAREKVEGLLSRVDRLISPQAGIGKG